MSAIDSGNLKAVAEALHAKYPEKPILIAGDDDRHLILTQGVNPGRSKAEEAAQAVGGKAIFPIFTRDEKNYPADLEPVTPQAYREHLRVTELLEKQPDLSEDARAKLHRSQLSKEQLNALQHMKKFTDFNDLSAKSELGKDGLRRQVLGAMEVNRPSQRKEFIRQTVQQRHVPQKQAHRGARI